MDIIKKINGIPVILNGLLQFKNLQLAQGKTNMRSYRVRVRERKGMNLLHFIETKVFQRVIEGLISPDELREFQEVLRLDPTAGDTISGTGGCRKIRWAMQGMGKSGGVRVIYYYMTADNEVFLLLAYPKSEKDNLTNAEKNQLKKAIEVLEQASKEARGEK